MRRLFIAFAVATSLNALDRGLLSDDQAAARSAARASTISLRGQRDQLQLAEAFQTQTGQSIRFDIPSREITVDWKDSTFWDAIASLEQSTQSSAFGDATARALVLRPRQPDAPRPVVASTGPFRVEILSQSPRPNLVDPTRAALQIRWRLRMEPRLRPLYVTVADRDCRLMNGTEAITPLSPDARREFPIDRWLGAEIDMAFQTPKSINVSKLKVGLSGHVKAAALPLELAFRDLDQPTPAPRRRGTVTGVVRNVDHNVQIHALQFDLKVTYDRGGPEFESHRMWIYQNAARLVRKEDGAVLSPAAVELKENAGAGATLAYLFESVNNPPGDFEFIYEAPSQLIDVPFKVDNVPLPAAKK